LQRTRKSNAAETREECSTRRLNRRSYITSAIEGPHDFDELKKTIYPRSLRPLVRYLVDDIYHESIVAALL
jgi:hypothetical protein